jgi:hypothetical protein
MDYLDAEILIAVRKLYPTLTESEAKNAARTLCRYFEIVFEMDEEEGVRASEVDTVDEGSNIKEERSNSLIT